MRAVEMIRESSAGRALSQLAGYFSLGFLSALCTLDGRAPLAAGLLAAIPPGRRSLSALAGALLSSLLLPNFGAALRCCGILVLICAILSAFQDLPWSRSALFRPLTAAGATLAVELAYALQLELTAEAAVRLLSCPLLAGALCHYCSLLLRETSVPRRKAGREAEWLRRRLHLSSEAIRSLCQSITAPSPGREENPAIIFDRAAEVVCRGCALRELCWSKEYIGTYNAFNDATPAILERGRAESADFAPHFASRCIHFPQLVSAINTEVTALLLRRQYRRRLEQERSRSRSQYTQLAELVARTMEADHPPASGLRELPHDVAMGSQPKEGQRLCGDSVTFFRGTQGEVHLLLSDGMGSGREAQRESRLALRLLEQFLTAGIDPPSALRTVNAALHLRSEDRGGFTTIDLATVHLTDGHATLYKYGAAPTYVKHLGNVRRLTGSSLPAGLQDVGAVPTPIRIPLEENTFLLLVSDGVADAADDKWLQDLLAGWQGEDPHVLVSHVLRQCHQRRQGEDDCSALCLYLPRREHGKREV